MQIKVTPSNKIASIGCDNHISGYLSSDNPYFGATVGRVANRIGKATFVVDGQRYNVSKNIGENSLHGGYRGWSFKVWNATVDGDRVVMTLVSPDGDEGYPGSVTATVSFQLNDDGELRIEMKAKSLRATPINLTNHGYFNLAGHVRRTFLSYLMQETKCLCLQEKKERKKYFLKHSALNERRNQFKNILSMN